MRGVDGVPGGVDGGPVGDVEREDGEGSPLVEGVAVFCGDLLQGLLALFRRAAAEQDVEVDGLLGEGEDGLVADAVVGACLAGLGQ